MDFADRRSLESFITTVSAVPDLPLTVKLFAATLDSSFTEYAPDKLVGDNAHDSDKLADQLINDRGIEMIAPHRKGPKKPKTQGVRNRARVVRLTENRTSVW